MPKWKNSYIWLPVILILASAALAVFNPEVNLSKWLVMVFAALIGFMIRILLKKDTVDSGNGESLYETIKAAGYEYDVKQDIFFSTMDSWQRKMGYCRLYDEAAAPMGMIIDCEPIYFDYDRKRWLIEFWKGQYDLTSGAEIGIYTTEDPDIDIPEVFTGTFFQSAKDEDHLDIAYLVKKNGKKLFGREDRHWWLTGFKLGEFSEPWELTMYLTITLKDETMKNAFIEGLINAGYTEKEIVVSKNTVRLVFDKPRTEQPFSRTKETDALIQKKNKLMCDKYQEITGPYDNIPEKLKAVQEEASELVDGILNMGKAAKLLGSYEKISN